MRLAQVIGRNAMETLQATGPLPGFEVVEPDGILPEIVDVGEYQEEANYRSRLHTQNHWLVFYLVEGSSQKSSGGSQTPKLHLTPLSVHPAVSKALEILETRFEKNWTLNELAQEVGLSRSRLAELFNLKTGYSIRKFLTRKRLQ